MLVSIVVSESVWELRNRYTNDGGMSLPDRRIATEFGEGFCRKLFSFGGETMSVISGLGRKNGVGAAVALALLGGTSHAVAQQTERGFTGVEEIVVTARKREETIQNTPVSMTAFSGEGIEARNIDSFSDLSNFAPNLDISGGIPNGGGSATQIFIRGVGQDDYSFPNEPGVGLYIDGVYISRSAAGDFGFLDIERIEVLRGPQGTLYGRNTIG